MFLFEKPLCFLKLHLGISIKIRKSFIQKYLLKNVNRAPESKLLNFFCTQTAQLLVITTTFNKKGGESLTSRYWFRVHSP